MKQKSWILSLLALVLIACAMVQPALAYFTAHTQADGAIPLYFERKTTIEEKVDGLHKAVTVKNTGGAHPEHAVPVWVRARAYVGQEYLQYLEVSGSGWSQGSDGWWYYGVPLMPEVIKDDPSSMTSPLNVSLINMPVDNGVEHQFKDVNVAVVYESITTYYNEDGSFRPYTAADWSKPLDTGSSTPSGS